MVHDGTKNAKLIRDSYTDNKAISLRYRKSSRSEMEALSFIISEVDKYNAKYNPNKHLSLADGIRHFSVLGANFAKNVNNDVTDFSSDIPIADYSINQTTNNQSNVVSQAISTPNDLKLILEDFQSELFGKVQSTISNSLRDSLRDSLSNLNTNTNQQTTTTNSISQSDIDKVVTEITTIVSDAMLPINENTTSALNDLVSGFNQIVRNAETQNSLLQQVIHKQQDNMNDIMNAIQNLNVSNNVQGSVTLPNLNEIESPKPIMMTPKVSKKKKSSIMANMGVDKLND